MKKSAGTKNLTFASINLGDEMARIEKLQANETGQEQVRFSLWSQGKMLPRPVSLTEEELITLLQAAIHEGVLSGSFWSNLHSVIEI